MFNDMTCNNSIVPSQVTRREPFVQPPLIPNNVHIFNILKTFLGVRIFSCEVFF